jgi:hypothetical protein
LSVSTKNAKKYTIVDLSPIFVKQFQFSIDPGFERNSRIVVGLYLTHPENSVILCVYEKSQIQAFGTVTTDSSICCLGCAERADV